MEEKSKSSNKQQGGKSKDNPESTKKSQEEKTKAEEKDECEFDFIKEIEDKIRQGIKGLSEIDLKKLNAGALFVGMEQLRKSVTVIDKRASNYAKDLSSKAVDTINKSIKEYKKNRYS